MNTEQQRRSRQYQPHVLLLLGACEWLSRGSIAEEVGLPPEHVAWLLDDMRRKGYITEDVHGYWSLLGAKAHHHTDTDDL